MCLKIRFAPLLTGLAAAIALTLGAKSSCFAADDKLAVEVRAVVKEIQLTIDKRGGGSVAIGAITAESRIKGGSGPEIQLLLSTELKKAGLTIDPDRYRFEVKGDYLGFVHPQSKLQGVKLVLRVVDAEDGGTLAEFARFVFGEESVPRMLGLSVKTPPNMPAEQRSEVFKEARANPGAKLEGSRIQAAADSKYAVEILVKEGSQYVARKLTPDTLGRPFVAVGKDEVFGVRLINDSAHEAAVNLCLDGINCFRFSNSGSTYWILPPKSHLDVIGWHKDDETSIEFKAVEFPDSAAARLKLAPSADIGLITAAFSAAWASDAEKPADESARAAGFGEDVKFKTQKVKRQIGTVRETVAVRYER